MARTKRHRRAWVAAAATTLTILSAIGMRAEAQDDSVERVPTDCDRACLEALVDRYLAAVVAHDPPRLPLSEAVIYTEDKQRVELGVQNNDGKSFYPFADDCDRIENGLIRRIEMVGSSVPFHPSSAWPGGLSGR